MGKALNYQGSKSKLLDNIDLYMEDYIQEGKIIFDLFAGGCSVTEHYFNKYMLYSNDVEIYSYHIANSLFQKGMKDFDKEWKEKFIYDYEKNYSLLIKIYEKEVSKEEDYIMNSNKEGLLEMYETFPTIWNGKYSSIIKDNLDWKKLSQVQFYCLMTTHYSSNYFGIKQAIELDSIRYAIEKTTNDYNKSYLFKCLYYSMNQSVFSKDGHMAQPLNKEKDFMRLIKCRKNSIFELFFYEIDKYKKQEVFYENRAYNYDILELLDKKEIFYNVGLIYADPPYTDMQYSRYYHLLTTITDYKYSEPTKNRDKYTSGLYLNNRKQSILSGKKYSLSVFEKILKLCKTFNINIVISYAYPDEKSEERTDRYTMNVNELINLCKTIFGVDEVEIKKVSYSHANHRNSKKKEVFEYLICCRGSL